MLQGLLRGCILCALLLIVFGLPKGPPRDVISAREVDDDDCECEEGYIPWLDEEANRCVFEKSTLPLDICISTYGRDKVAFWPRRNPNPPGTLGSIPGANIGR